MAHSLDARAEAAQQALFGRYDQLNALWTQGEEQLTRMHIPHSVSYDYSKWMSEDGPYYEYAAIALVKIAGKWRICYGTFDDINPDRAVWTPIVECSAEVRIDAAKHLPKLREAVVEAAERFIPKVDKAIAELQAALSSEGEGDLKELLAERAKLNGKAK